MCMFAAYLVHIWLVSCGITLGRQARELAEVAGSRTEYGEGRESPTPSTDADAHLFKILKKRV